MAPINTARSTEGWGPANSTNSPIAPNAKAKRNGRASLRPKGITAPSNTLR